MATVRAACPSCGNGLKFPSSWAGKAMKCQKCGSVITAKVTAAAVPVDDATPERNAVPVPTAPPDHIPMIHPVSIPTFQPESFSPASSDDTNLESVFAVTPTRRYEPLKSGFGSMLGIVALLIGGAAVGVFGFQYYQKTGAKSENSSEGPIVTGITTPKTSTTTAGTVMPRRLLFVNVTKYAYLNPLSAGEGPRGDSAGEAARKLAFEWRVPSDGPTSQFYLLSDTAGKEARPIVKAVLQPTLERFIETSRKQDRIVIYMGGHAVEKEGKAYFAAADGDVDDLTSLIPIDAIYDRLKNCPAQQKVIIWDVARFNPQFGRSMPGSEPMPESLHKLLTAAPTGVQAWVTCSPHENAVELTRTGSEFLQAFRITGERATGPKGHAAPGDPIPVADWLTAVQSKLGQLVRKDDKAGQTMMLAGAISGESTPPNPDEPATPRFEFPPPPKGADPVKVADAFALIDLPTIRSDKNSLTAKAGQSLYVSEEAIKEYLIDAIPADEAIKQKEKFPIRASAAKAMMTMRKVWKGAEGDGLRETFVGEASDAAKKAILKEQEVPARIILELESIITECEKLEKQVDQEPSKRWRATFLYAFAQAKARWAYMNEYNLMLGIIQKNELPPLEEKKGQTGWAMISSDTMKSKKDVKEKLESSQELFDKIATDHKGTPWAVLAKQAKNAKLGLEWRTVGPDSKRE